MKRDLLGHFQFFLETQMDVGSGLIPIEITWLYLPVCTLCREHCHPRGWLLGMGLVLRACFCGMISLPGMCGPCAPYSQDSEMEPGPR